MFTGSSLKLKKMFSTLEKVALFRGLVLQNRTSLAYGSSCCCIKWAGALESAFVKIGECSSPLIVRLQGRLMNASLRNITYKALTSAEWEEKGIAELP